MVDQQLTLPQRQAQFVLSLEEPLSPIPHINIAPPDIPCGDKQY